MLQDPLPKKTVVGELTWEPSIVASQTGIAANSNAIKRIADHGLFPWLLTSTLVIGFFGVVWIVLTILP
jgi:hypothetical protein